MFCINCGAKLSDGAKFCAYCGTKQVLPDEHTSFNNTIADKVNTGTQLVPAKCTNCGGQLTVNPEQQAAVCPFCNSAFIVEQAINNFNVKMNGNLNVGNATINVQGLNTKNLYARAKEFEAHNDFDNAIDYYNKVLDIDINNIEAQAGIRRVEQKKLNHVYISFKEQGVFVGDTTIEVRKNRITRTKSRDKIEDFYFNKMTKLDSTLNALQFEYPGHWTAVTIGCQSRSQAKEVKEFINNALKGIYPY